MLLRYPVNEQAWLSTSKMESSDFPCHSLRCKKILELASRNPDDIPLSDDDDDNDDDDNGNVEAVVRSLGQGMELPEEVIASSLSASGAVAWEPTPHRNTTHDNHLSAESQQQQKQQPQCQQQQQRDVASRRDHRQSRVDLVETVAKRQGVSSDAAKLNKFTKRYVHIIVVLSKYTG